jgi:ferredoxin
MKQKNLKTIRIAVAAIMFALFFGVGIGVQQLNAVLVTQFAPGLLSLTSVFFVDTLAAVVLIAAVTLVFGRIYCSVLCPLGILQDGIAFLTHWNQKKWKWSRYRFLDTRPVKYGVFLFVLILGAAGVMLPLVALLPSSNFFTIVSNVFLKFFNLILELLARGAQGVAENGFLAHFKVAHGPGSPGWYESVIPPAAAFAFSLGIFLVVAALAAWRGRIYCNTLCPVGAVLSLIGRKPLYRIALSQEMCVCCGMCEAACKGGAINAKAKSVLTENCVMCFNCIGACKRGGVTLEKRPKMAAFSLSRRHFIGAAGGVVAGAGAYMLVRKLENTMPRPSSSAWPAMPPGAGSAKRFHEKCVGCGICIRECEGHVLVPSVTQYGLEGFMQPVVDYSRGSCVYTCNHCSNVCPAGALLPLSLEAKQLTRIGTASTDYGACVGCGICASNCPAHAIQMMTVVFPADHAKPNPAGSAWYGASRPVVRSVPVDHSRKVASVNLFSCIGCGVCQNVCPLPDGPAITVSGVVEQILVKPSEVQHYAEDPEKKPAEAEKANEAEKPADAEKPNDAPAKPVAVVNTQECFGCGLCAEECPLSAIEMVDGLPRVNADACVGCGLCAENCPAGAIEIRGG